MQEKSDVTRWCLGLPLAEKRQMTIFERAALMREAQSWGRKSWLLWVIYGALVILFLFFAISANPNAVITQSVLAGTCIMLMMIVLPVCILVSRDWVRRSRGFRHSAVNGSMSRYEGEVPEEALIDPAYTELSKIVSVFPQAHCVIEVLAGSRALWTINAERVPAWITALEIEVAEVPIFTISNGQRDLSLQEKEELLGHARIAWLQTFPLALGLSFWAGLQISGVILTGFRGNFLSLLHPFVLAAAATSVDIVLVRGIIHSRRLNADRRGGVVSIWEDGGESEEVLFEEDVEIEIEVLPHSKLLWTEQGIPAGWRKVQL